MRIKRAVPSLMITAVVVMFTWVAVAVVTDLYIAMNRARQKRTMATVIQWGSAFESMVAGDNKAADARVRKLAREDAWGTPLRIQHNAKGYVIQAAGADRRFQKDIRPGAITTVAQDIVFADGHFVQYPEGI
ncbi:MAG: hypothetical protein M3Q69_07970 [Acidobacteriota bacterium]|nr:hypothetical protein [Acidobacteriota bacterium]